MYNIEYMDYLIDRLGKLSDYYLEYADKHKDVNMHVTIENKQKKGTIQLKLFDEKEEIDTFEISFKRLEYKKYFYISLKLISLLLGKVVIYKDNDILYNNKHKPNLKVYVKDEKIMDIVSEMIDKQYEISLERSIDENIKKPRTILYPINFMYQLDDRVELTRESLRGK